MDKPATQEAYLAALPDDQRVALDALRARIVARLPENAEPCISYAMPGFRVNAPKGTNVAAGFAAFARHLGYYPHSGSVVPRIAERLAAEGFKTSKSGVLFTPERPLPDWALDEMIRLRLAEIG